MKQLIIITLLLLLGLDAEAQEKSEQIALVYTRNDVISSLSGNAASNMGSIQYTIGQAIAGEIAGGGYRLEQGFQNPYLQFTTVQTKDQVFGSVAVYPNPAKDFCLVSFSEPSSSALKILLYDAFGRMIQEISVSPNAKNAVLGLEGVPRGLLLIEVQTAAGKSKSIRRVLKR